MFEEMRAVIQEEVIQYMFHMHVEQPSVERVQVAKPTNTNMDATGEECIIKKQPKVNEEKLIGRNDSCPCGSGKKYKNCCGKTK
jgi:preprotein translocase subunit SecA